MEDYDVLKQLLDTLCDRKQVKSWTVHENSFGTNVTIRYVSKPATSDTALTPTSTTYKQKSGYQIKHDRARMEQFNRRKTRSQTAIENARCGDDQQPQEDSDDDRDESDVASLIETSPDSRTDTISLDQNISPDRVISLSSPISANLEDVPHIKIPVIPEVIQTDSSQLSHEINIDPAIVIPEQATGINRTLFYDHIGNHSRINQSDIKCNTCEYHIRSCSIIELGYYRLRYCSICDRYVCTRCEPPYGPNKAIHSPCKNQLDFIT